MQTFKVGDTVIIKATGKPALVIGTHTHQDRAKIDVMRHADMPALTFDTYELRHHEIAFGDTLLVRADDGTLYTFKSFGFTEDEQGLIIRFQGAFKAIALSRVVRVIPTSLMTMGA